MNSIEKLIVGVDKFQRKHRLPAFIYAVIKKYGDDKTGYQSALLTYYSFLAIFPLLLVLTTLAGIVAHSHPDLKATILTSMTSYFPVLGSQLSEHIQTLHKNGVALIIGIVFTLFGARGVVDVFRHGVNHIWHEPDTRSEAFPVKAAKSIGIMMIGGFGLLAASILAGAAAAAGHGLLFRILSLVVNFIILFLLFTFLINASLPRQVSLKETRAGAAAAAIGLVILQALGGYLLTRELKSLDALYSYFAISLGLLFWVYLQAQMIYYAVTISVVSSKGLWPRSLSGNNLTPADKRVAQSNSQVLVN